MPDNKELELLLKNIQEGLRVYSIKELNEAIIETLNKTHDKREEVDFVLKSVSKEYNIPVRNLKKSKARGLMQDAKQTAYCLLHFELGLTIRYIANRIFFTWSSSVFNGVKRFRNVDTKIKQDKEFMDKYTKLQSELLNFLTKKNISNEC